MSGAIFSYWVCPFHIYFTVIVYFFLPFTEALKTIETEHSRQAGIMREQAQLMERMENDLYHLKEISSSSAGVK